MHYISPFWVNLVVGSMKNEKLEDLDDSRNVNNHSVALYSESTGVTNIHSEDEKVIDNKSILKLDALYAARDFFLEM